MHGITTGEKLTYLWKMTGSPIRPEKSVVEAYRKLMRLEDNPRALVLGATPELVDVLLEAGASRVVCYDISADSIETMKPLASQDWSKVESVLGDWREPKAELQGAFDLLVGDCTHIFLPFPDDWASTHSTFSKYLRPGGIAVLRQVVYPPQPFDFEKSSVEAYERFDARSQGLEGEAWMQCLVDLKTALHVGVLVASAQSDGTISVQRLMENGRNMYEQLTKRFGDELIGPMNPMREVPSNLTESESPVVMPRSIPAWERVKSVLEQSGFQVVSEEYPDTNAPAPQNFCLMKLIVRS